MTPPPMASLARVEAVGAAGVGAHLAARLRRAVCAGPKTAVQKFRDGPFGAPRRRLRRMEPRSARSPMVDA
jgi:hypothetical protein